ncbi:MAG: hypothetical protein ACI9A2_004403, partial [Halioglobus sp.]
SIGGLIVVYTGSVMREVTCEFVPERIACR